MARTNDVRRSSFPFSIFDFLLLRHSDVGGRAARHPCAERRTLRRNNINIFEYLSGGAGPVLARRYAARDEGFNA